MLNREATRKLVPTTTGTPFVRPEGPLLHSPGHRPGGWASKRTRPPWKGKIGPVRPFQGGRRIGHGRSPRRCLGLL